MWRSSRRLIIDCIQFVFRCGRNDFNADNLDDISDYDVQDVPMYFQPQTFGLSAQPRQDDLQHRPNAPGTKRTSSPEVVTKMLQALEEMGEPVRSSEKIRGVSPKPPGYRLHSETSSRTN
ncbi:hypothetical protein PUN28_014876 [Cardiocondyla obscurior]|uniref:Uncharacterized protein n=2 Tax=Cardiocondyla obscurior TaxID=286306 RepID=A0AAW2F162_9HYME